VGFFHKKNFKSAQIGHFGAKNAQKVPFSENASEFFCPLLVFKTGLLPTFSGLFSRKLSVHAQKIFSKVGFRPNPPNKSGLKFTQFSSMYGLISLISKPVRSVYQPE
jgi:hypothetical protein